MDHTNDRYVVEDELFMMITLVSRTVGLAPVRFTITHKHTLMYISRLFLICGIVCSTIFHATFCYVVYNILEESIRSVEYYKKMNAILYWLGFFCATTLLINHAVFYGVSRMRNFMDCVHQIQKIRKRVDNNTKRYFKKWKFYLFIITILCVVCTLSILDIWFYKQWNNPGFYLVGLSYLIMNLLELQFMAIAFSINYVLKAINKSLQEMLMKIRHESENYKWTYGHQIPVKSINAAIDLIGMTNRLYPNIQMMQRVKVAHKIRHINHSFVSTSEALRNMNKSEGFTLLLHFAVFSLDLAVTVNNILHSTHEKDSSDNLKRIVNSMWLLYHMTRILLLVEPCHRTETEVFNTQLLVGRMMCYVSSETDPLRDEVDDFSKQLRLNDVSYSAMGICHIGRPLISTIIGSVTTIIAFLHQI